MTDIIAVVNQKGGVGKTGSAVEIAYELARNYSVLYVDLDGQANGTKHILGELPKKGIYDLMVDPELDWTDYAMDSPDHWGNLMVLPGTRKLHELGKVIADRLERELILKNILEPIKAHVDWIVIDNPSVFDVRSINALCAANLYLVPTDSSEYAIEGVQAITTLAETIKARLNPDLEFWGIIITKFEKGNSHAVRAVVAQIEAEFPLKTKAKVNNSVRMVEAQRGRKSVQLIDAESQTAIQYRDISRQIVESRHD